jgi:hypothetical protein
MSTVKNPRRKKILSLKRDHRSVFGENTQAGRKNIAKSKQRNRMSERRVVHQVLHQIKGDINVDTDADTDAASKVEFEAKLKMADSRHRGFKKQPDVPLGEVLKQKKSQKPTRHYL